MGKIKYRPPRGLLKELRKIADAYIEKVGGAWIMVLHKFAGDNRRPVDGNAGC